MRYCLHSQRMAGWPSGKAMVCKTVIRGFDSRSRLHAFVEHSLFASISTTMCYGGVAKWEGIGLQNRYERVRFPPPPP